MQIPEGIFRLTVFDRLFSRQYSRPLPFPLPFHGGGAEGGSVEGPADLQVEDLLRAVEGKVGDEGGGRGGTFFLTFLIGKGRLLLSGGGGLNCSNASVSGHFTAAAAVVFSFRPLLLHLLDHQRADAKVAEGPGAVLLVLLGDHHAGVPLEDHDEVVGRLTSPVEDIFGGHLL